MRSLIEIREAIRVYDPLDNGMQAGRVRWRSSG